MRPTGADPIFDGRFPRDLFHEDQGPQLTSWSCTMTLHAPFPSTTATASVSDAKADYSRAEEQSARVSRWTSVLYLMTALATPLLLYFGPDVLSPTAAAIANAALDGRFSVHRNPACVTVVAPNETRAATAKAC
jgi:hypothetical protein